MTHSVSACSPMLDWMFTVQQPQSRRPCFEREEHTTSCLHAARHARGDREHIVLQSLSGSLVFVLYCLSRTHVPISLYKIGTVIIKIDTTSATIQDSQHSGETGRHSTPHIAGAPRRNAPEVHDARAPAMF